MILKKKSAKLYWENYSKQAIQAASIDGDRIYFMVEDHHFTDPSFYALIDSLLASGEVNSSSRLKFLNVQYTVRWKKEMGRLLQI